MISCRAVVLVVLCAAQGAVAFVPSRTLVEGTVPPGWERETRSDPKQPINLVFAVKQQNLEALHAVFEAVSDPSNALYGKHLSNERVHELIAPLEAHVGAVFAYLRAHNTTPVATSPNSDFVEATVPVAVAEQILQTQYHVFRHAGTNTRVHRATSYSLPTELSGAVDFVAPVLRFPPVHHAGPLVSTAPAEINTPHKLRRLYKVGDTVGQAAGNRQAVTGFIGQHFSARDLDEFILAFYHEAEGTVMATKGDDPTSVVSGVEAMLDAEYIIATGTNISSEFWGFKGYAPGSTENEPFLKWMQLVSNTTDEEVPLVFSTSYGEDEDTVDADYAARINVEFQKAGARGISLLFASGDSGAAGDGGECKNDQFVPMWPAASPYVTAVGGTTGSNPERAIGLSSGGFSNRYGLPSWQSDAVHSYITTAKDMPSSKAYNASGRAFPDIASQADGFVVVSNLVPMPGVAGTSCASPTAAGIIALLNDARLLAGKSTLGFLNPLLYKEASKLTDITEGRNHGCGAYDGFPAAKGWDAVTGLGTLDFAALVEVVLALP